MRWVKGGLVFKLTCRASELRSWKQHLCGEALPVATQVLPLKDPLLNILS